MRKCSTLASGSQTHGNFSRFCKNWEAPSPVFWNLWWKHIFWTWFILSSALPSIKLLNFQLFKLSPVIASPYFLSNVILKTFYIFLLELLVCKPAWKQRPRASVRQRNCYWHDIQYCQSFTHHFKASWISTRAQYYNWEIADFMRREGLSIKLDFCVLLLDKSSLSLFI